VNGGGAWRGWGRAAWAVAGETWRTLLWRSGGAAAAGAVVAGVCALLPLALESGAAPAERLTLYLTYATGATGFLLSVFSLWAGCAAVSAEAERGLLGVLLAKPAARGAVWAGKWLAVAAADVALLAAAGAVTAVVAGTMAARMGVEDRRDCALAAAAYETRRAPVSDVSEAVARRMAAWRAQGGGRVTEAQAAKAFERDELAKRYRLGTDRPLAWRFDVSGRRTGGTVRLGWFCHPSMPGTVRLKGELALGDGRRIALDAPAGVRRDVLLDWPEESGDVLEATLRLADDPETAGVDFHFDPADGVIVRIPRGGVAANAAKAWLACAGRLALLAAVGVTLGTAFSMPVASFLALALLLLLQCGDLLDEAASVDRRAFVGSLLAVMDGAHSHGGGDAADGAAAAAEGGWRVQLATGIYGVYRATAWGLQPFLADRSAEQFRTAEWIEPRALARRLAWQWAVLPAALGAAGAWILRRREWGGPGR